MFAQRAGYSSEAEQKFCSVKLSEPKEAGIIVPRKNRVLANRAIDSIATRRGKIEEMVITSYAISRRNAKTTPTSDDL